jgi:hypothetical protein
VASVSADDEQGRPSIRSPAGNDRNISKILPSETLSPQETYAGINAAGELENPLNILNHFGLIDADGRIMPGEVKSDGIRSEETESNK